MEQVKVLYLIKLLNRKLLTLKPSKSLNKAYFKQSLTGEEIEIFKKELKNTFNHIDEKQDEE